MDSKMFVGYIGVFGVTETRRQSSPELPAPSLAPNIASDMLRLPPGTTLTRVCYNPGVAYSNNMTAATTPPAAHITATPSPTNALFPSLLPVGVEEAPVLVPTFVLAL